MKANQINIVAFAVLGNLQQIEHAQKPRLARQLRSDIGIADRCDGLDLDFAITHPVAVAHRDVRAGPDAYAARDLPTHNSLAKPLDKDHNCKITGYRSQRTGSRRPRGAAGSLSFR